MFDLDGKQYELKFTEQRIDLVEAVLKSSLIGEFMQSNGMLRMMTAKVVFQFCLKEVGADTFLTQPSGLDVYNRYMQQVGYMNLLNQISSGLTNDTPFLFPHS